MTNYPTDPANPPPFENNLMGLGMDPYLAAQLGVSGLPQTLTQQKFIINFGLTKRTDYVKANIQTMEQSQFDGVTIKAGYVDPFFNAVSGISDYDERIFQGYAIPWALLATALSELQTTTFSRFTENFLRINGAQPGTVDWFNANSMSAVVNNYYNAARLAKEGGLRGIFLDMEQYDDSVVFEYPELLLYSTKTFNEYRVQVRLMARQIMDAMQAAYPGITILLALGYYQASQSYTADLTTRRYGLYPSFLDGLYDQAIGNTTLHNMFELSFGWIAEVDWNYGQTLNDKPPHISTEKWRYDKYNRQGFSSWLDYESDTRGFDFVDTSLNYNTPAQFTTNIYEGLRRSDKYFWVYNQVPEFWDYAGAGDQMPAGYYQSLIDARVQLGLEPEFSPAIIPGIQGYWDVDSLSSLADAASISSWTDLSGNAHVASQTGANRPTYDIDGFAAGYPAVLFTAASSQNMLCNTLAAAFVATSDAPKTFMVICKQVNDAPSDPSYFLGLGVLGAAFPSISMGCSNAPRWTFRKINDANASTTANSSTLTSSPSNETPQVWIVRIRDGLIQMFLNGTVNLVVTASTRTGNYTFSAARIGSSVAEATIGYNDGWLSVVACWNTFLENQDVYRLTAWGMAKAGITHL